MVEELVRTCQMRPLPEPLLLELGATLLDRGEDEGAARVLERATSSPAFLLLADLAERRADLPTALSLIERVLLRDLDHPGARERHRRWRSQLGFDLGEKPVQVTLKDAKGTRLKRVEVKASGEGVVEVSFDIPADVKAVSFAGLVGTSIKDALQHLQSKPVKVQ